jgi:hypothetical protein
VSRLTAPARVLLALIALLVSGSVWFVLVLYLFLEEMGARSHPALDLVAWFALAVMAAAAVVLSVGAVGAVLRLLNRRSGARRL